MDRKTVIGKIHQVCGPRTVIITEKFGYYAHLPEDQQPVADYCVSVNPGLNGASITLFTGDNLQACLESFANAVTNILESK